MGSIRYDLATQVRDLGSLQVHPEPTLVYNSQIDWGAVRKEPLRISMIRFIESVPRWVSTRKGPELAKNHYALMATEGASL